MIHVDEKE